MAFPDGSRNSLIPSFLYHSSSACQSLDSRRFASPTLPSSPAFQNTGPASEAAAGAMKMDSLWIGLVGGVPSYYLVGSLVDLGMAWTW